MATRRSSSSALVPHDAPLQATVPIAARRPSTLKVELLFDESPCYRSRMAINSKTLNLHELPDCFKEFSTTERLDG